MADARPTVTKAALLSDAANKAFESAAYRLRKNRRYADWSLRRRWDYCIAKAFDAAVQVQESIDG